MSGRKIGVHTPLTLADSQVTAWMNSAAHKRNLLNRTAVAIGCGISFYNNSEFEQMPSVYAVQNFQLGKPIIVGSRTNPQPALIPLANNQNFRWNQKALNSFRDLTGR